MWELDPRPVPRPPFPLPHQDTLGGGVRDSDALIRPFSGTGRDGSSETPHVLPLDVSGSSPRMGPPQGAFPSTHPLLPQSPGPSSFSAVTFPGPRPVTRPHSLSGLDLSFHPPSCPRRLPRPGLDSGLPEPGTRPSTTVLGILPELVPTTEPDYPYGFSTPRGTRRSSIPRSPPTHVSDNSRRRCGCRRDVFCVRCK